MRKCHILNIVITIYTTLILTLHSIVAIKCDTYKQLQKKSIDVPTTPLKPSNCLVEGHGTTCTVELDNFPYSLGQYQIDKNEGTICWYEKSKLDEHIIVTKINLNDSRGKVALLVNPSVKIEDVDL